MSRVSEQWSKSKATSQGRTDANLSNDSNNLGGIPAEDYATKKYVQDYHNGKEENLKQYIDQQDASVLEQAKEYTNSQIRNQDFSNFAEVKDLEALNKNLSTQITDGLNAQKQYTDQKTNQIVEDVNANFQDVENSISKLNGNVNSLFQSVSNGKSVIAEAITDKGVPTSASDSYSTMAGNIRAIPTSGGGGGVIPPGYYDTSDATATPYDILQGKSAYGKNGKIEGILKIDESSGQPSYDIGSVEKIYSSDVNSITQEKMTVYSVSPSSFSYYNNSTDKAYHFWYSFCIKDSKLRIQNKNTKEIRELDLVNDLKIKVLSSDTDTTGTTADINICDIAITKSQTYSYLAILAYKQNELYKGSNYYSDYTLILIPFNSNGDYIEQFAFDTENNKYYYLNKYCTSHKLITTSLVLIRKAISISEDGNKMAITLRGIYGNYDGGVIFFLKINPITLNINFLNCVTNNNYNYINQPIIFPSINENIAIMLQPDSGSKGAIFVLNENNRYVFNNITPQDTGRISTSVAISEDGLHYIAVFYKNNNKTYFEYGNIIINYDTGNVDSVAIATKELPFLISGDDRRQSYRKPFFMGNGKIFITNYESPDYTTILAVYKVDFDGNDILQPIVNYDNILTDYFNTYAGTNCVVFSDGNKLELAPDYSNIIALKYDGEYYYKHEKGTLTATPQDVLNGKTFIGYEGLQETGTMEV